MKTLFIMFFCFSTKICGAQEPLLKEKGNSQSLTLNINSKNFIRVLDGFELKANNPVPKIIKINSVRRTSDTLKLQHLGIKDVNNLYMFLSSFASDTRRYIYAKAKIDYELQEVNLPIILNNKIITFDKYSLLDKLDTSQILTAKYVRVNKMGSYETPLGVIVVTYE
jgi:hypothetical protein